MNNRPIEHSFIDYSDTTEGYHPSYFQNRLFETLGQFRHAAKMRVTIEMIDEEGKEYTSLTAIQEKDKVTFKEINVSLDTLPDAFSKFTSALTNKIESDKVNTHPDCFGITSSGGDSK